MQHNATSWRDIYIVEVTNSDVNATFYVELVNYLGHVSVNNFMISCWLSSRQVSHVHVGSVLQENLFSQWLI